MFGACGVWCLADISSVSPSLEQVKGVPRPTVVLLTNGQKISDSTRVMRTSSASGDKLKNEEMKTLISPVCACLCVYI